MARNPPTGIGWALWIAVAALPWLLPIHSELWGAFYSEAAAAGVVLPIALWVVFRSPQPISLDMTAAALFALVLVPVAQAGLGMWVFPGEAWLVALYLGAFATTALIAREAQLVRPLRLVEALLAALALASLLSAGLALYQWLDQDWLGIFVHYQLVSGRAYANLGQPNNLATLLCWGLVAIWWGHHRRKVGGLVAGAAAAFLLLGVVLTRSRTGWIEIALLVFAALYIRGRHGVGPNIRQTLLLLAWFVVLAVGLEPIANQVLREAPARLSDQSSIGLRPMIWRVALDEVAQRPLTGYGWNQSVPAYLTVADRYPDLQLVVNHAHNFVLDVLVWNGVPLGVLIFLGMAAWARSQWRGCCTQEQRLLLLCLAILFVHSLLELPHTYLFFLLPAAAMVGSLSAMAPSRTVMALPRWGVASLAVALGAALVFTVSDYVSIERDLQAARMRAAGIHNPNPPAPPHPIVLGFLQTALVQLRTEPKRDLPAEQLAAMRHALDRYPLVGALFHYARVSALAGRPDEAQWALERLCLLSRHCDSAIRDWGEMAAQGNPEMSVVVMPRRR